MTADVSAPPVWSESTVGGAICEIDPNLRAALAMHDGAARVLSDAFHARLDAGMSWAEIVRESERPAQEIRRLWDRVRAVDLVGEA